MNGRGKLRRDLLGRPKSTKHLECWEGEVASTGAYNTCNLSAGGTGAKATIYHELACIEVLSFPEDLSLSPRVFSRTRPTYSLACPATELRLLAKSPHHNLGIAMSFSVLFTIFSAWPRTEENLSSVCDTSVSSPDNTTELPMGH